MPSICIVKLKNWEENLFSNCPSNADLHALKEKLRVLFSTSTDVRPTLKKKHFSGKIVYTMNFDLKGHAHRLIFEKSSSGTGQTIFVLRSIAFFHDYKKALSFQSLPRVDFTSAEETVLHDADIEEVDSECIHYNEQWLQLSSQQSSFLTQNKFPMLVSGPPGSGKTLLSHALFERMALEHQETDDPLPLKLLYLTKSKPLADKMRQEWGSWAAANLGQSPSKVFAVFLSFDALADWHYQLSQKDAEVDDNARFHSDECKGYIKRLIEKYHLNSAYTADDIFHEFVLTAKVLSDDLLAKNTYESSEYKKLGLRQTSLTDKRENAYALYKQLTDTLTAEQKYYPEFRAISALSDVYKYDLVCVDESQLSGTQSLFNAFEMAKDGRVVYFADAHQRQETRYSPLTLLEVLIHQKAHQTFEKTLLTTTHRLSPAAAKLCNDIILLDTHLSQGLPEKTAYAGIDASHLGIDLSATEEEGCLRWASTSEDNTQMANLRNCATAAAIVLTEEDKPAGSLLIGGSGNVFTAKESQGLQFSHVVVYLSKGALKEFAPVSQGMHDAGIDASSNLTPKTSLSSTKSRMSADGNSMLSTLLVSLSRSFKHLWIKVEGLNDKERYAVRYFLKWLEAKCQAPNSAQAHVTLTTESTNEQWLRVIHEFLNNENVEQALLALVRQFSLTESQANAYAQYYCEQLNSRVPQEKLMERCREHLSQLQRRVASVGAEAAVCSATATVADKNEANSLMAAANTQKKPRQRATQKQIIKPDCLGGITSDSDAKTLALAVLALLELKEKDEVIGYWLCKHALVDGRSLFSLVYSNYKNVVILNINLQGKISGFFEKIRPYFVEPALGGRE